MPITIELGLRIRAIRKSRNLSQEQLAELCNLHPTYIGQLERGEKMPPLKAYAKSQMLFICLWKSYSKESRSKNQITIMRRCGSTTRSSPSLQKSSRRSAAYFRYC